MAAKSKKQITTEGRHDSKELKAAAAQAALRRDLAASFSATLSQQSVKSAFDSFEEVLSNISMESAGHMSALGADASLDVLREVYKSVLLNHYVREDLRRVAASVLDVWAIFLPQRIVNEDLADYLQDINRRIAKGQRWKAYLRVVAAIFWTGVNAVRHFQSQVSKKAGSSNQ
jgi:hypothetical protein